MRALSVKQKQFFYTQAVFGKLRFIAKPLYDALIGALLIGNRFLDYFSPLDTADISELTLVIKTFERNKSVIQLIKSIKRRYPSAKIMVVNDSQHPIEFEGVENLILPYDVGISVGRNKALEQLTTTYFLLLDDDFVFSRRQNLGLLLREMNTYSEIDILGGRCIDLPLYTVHDFHGRSMQSSVSPVLPLGMQLGDNQVVGKVQNYFIARTSSVRKNKWNDALKVQEHTEFFTRAYGKLVTAYRQDMLILHAKTPFDVSYLMKRFRSR